MKNYNYLLKSIIFSIYNMIEFNVENFYILIYNIYSMLY